MNIYMVQWIWGMGMACWLVEERKRERQGKEKRTHQAQKRQVDVLALMFDLKWDAELS